ncbi:MAG: pilus assembly protein TadG-related protein [Hyphomicrobium sp.]
MRNFDLSLRRFSSDDKGAVAVIFCLSSIVLTMLVGLAVDTARYHNFSSHSQSALDAATLAAAKQMPNEDLSTEEIRALAIATFNSAMSSLGVQAATMAPLDLDIDRNNAIVKATFTAHVPSLFGSLAGMSPLTKIVQGAQVKFDMTKVELAMVLDITGSMNDNNKMSDMKAAAKDVVDTLFKNSLNEKHVRIALAPYSASVNAGALANAVTDIPSTTSCGWSWHSGWSCKTAAGTDADTCVIERQGANAATDAAPVGADKLPNVPSTPYGRYSGPPAPVLPLLGRSEADTIKNTIDSYAAVGATAGHIGTAWGWYLLSPAWAGVLPTDSEPDAYDEDNLQKAMIIMTDGLFNTSYLSGGSTPAAQQVTESYDQFDALCNSIKGKGIKVYTVGFDLADATALAKLRGCASDPDTDFFDAKTGAALKKAFRDIAERLGSLRVAS